MSTIGARHACPETECVEASGGARGDPPPPTTPTHSHSGREEEGGKPPLLQELHSHGLISVKPIRSALRHRRRQQDLMFTPKGVFSVLFFLFSDVVRLREVRPGGLPFQVLESYPPVCGVCARRSPPPVPACPARLGMSVLLGLGLLGTPAPRPIRRYPPLACPSSSLDLGA